MTEVLGRMFQLPEGRIVFLADHPDEPETFLIGFKNKDGDDTTLKLSAKALDALVALRSEPDVGKPERPFPFKEKPPQWRVYEKTDGAP